MFGSRLQDANLLLGVANNIALVFEVIRSLHRSTDGINPHLSAALSSLDTSSIG